MPPVAGGWSSGRPGTAALAIAGVYVAVMAVLSFKYHVIGDYGVETDFYTFVSEARGLLRGDFHTDGARGPVYFIVLAVMGEILRDYFRAGLAIGLISSGLTIYFTYLLVKRLFDEPSALLVTLLTLCNPVFVQHTYSSGTDMLFVALVTVTFYAALAPKRLSYLGVSLCGVLCALAYLTRYHGVFLLMGVVLSLLFVNLSAFTQRERLIRCGVFCLVFAALIVPWGLFLKEQTGEFFYNPNYKNVAFLVYGQGRIDWDEFIRNQGETFQSYFDVVKRDPLLFVKTTAGSLVRHAYYGLTSMMGWHIGVLTIPGLALTLLRGPSGKQSAYVLLNVLALGTLASVAYNPRFSLILIPFYAVMASRALLIAARHFGRRVVAISGLGPVLAGALVVVTLVDSIRFNSDKISEGPTHVLKTAEWFHERIPEAYRRGVVVARKPHIGYYLGLEFKWLPDVRGYAQLMKALKTMNADYLYFSYIEAHWRPELAPLLDPEAEHPGLVPLVCIGRPPVSVLYAVEEDR